MGILDFIPKWCACVGWGWGHGIRRRNIKTGPKQSLTSVLVLSSNHESSQSLHATPRPHLHGGGARRRAQGHTSTPQRAGNLKFHTCLLPTRPRIWREGLGSHASASLDPRFTLTQQQIPSQNSSSVQISICRGSREMPHGTEPPVRGMYATRHLRKASLQQVPRRVWRRDGRTHTCMQQFPAGFTPPVGHSQSPNVSGAAVLGSLRAPPRLLLTQTRRAAALCTPALQMR